MPISFKCTTALQPARMDADSSAACAPALCKIRQRGDCWGAAAARAHSGNWYRNSVVSRDSRDSSRKVAVEAQIHRTPRTVTLEFDTKLNLQLASPSQPLRGPQAALKGPNFDSKPNPNPISTQSKDSKPNPNSSARPPTLRPTPMKVKIFQTALLPLSVRYGLYQ